MKGFHEHLSATREEAFEECKHVVYVSGKDNNINVQTIDLRKWLEAIFIINFNKQIKS